MEEKTGKISEGIQATIELLESIPVRMKDMDPIGFTIMTAIRNLYLIKDATVRAENGAAAASEKKDIPEAPEEAEGGEGA